MEIARRSRGTPRVANRLLRRVRDYRRGQRPTASSANAIAADAMQLLRVDAQGFDTMDRRLLKMIIDNFDGGPVGVESIAAALSEERGTIEDVLEPFLIQQGYMTRTARGPDGHGKGVSSFRVGLCRGSGEADLVRQVD